jgi:hypothetical protein
MLDLGCWLASHAQPTLAAQPGLPTSNIQHPQMSPLVENVPLLRFETPIPSCDDYAACNGTRQDYPAARATTARGLDGTRRKPEPHIPHKREWELLESATGDISIEVRMGTFLTRDDTSNIRSLRFLAF